MSLVTHQPTVLHYVGYDVDRGGILSVIRTLSREGFFRCVLGVNRGFRPTRSLELVTQELPPMAGEVISLRQMGRAFGIARVVGSWLHASGDRVFHGHSRAGVLVALWLRLAGHDRIVVTVHCYGRQKWVYRWAALMLGDRLFWLTPAMRRYYGVAERGWNQCLPECVPVAADVARDREVRRGAIRLGGIGTLVAWKGWHLVIAALAELRAVGDHSFSFRHVGSHDNSAASVRYTSDLQTMTVAAGLADTVAWLGERPAVDSFLQELDFLVVASDHEPCSVAMLEALQAGVPVIAADSGGSTDVIQPPRNGVLFRSGDSHDLARVLASLAKRSIATDAAVDQASLRRFQAPVAAAAHAEIYRQLIRP